MPVWYGIILSSIWELHVPAVLSAYFEKSLCYLAERAVLNGFHQFFENVLVVYGFLLKRLESFLACFTATLPKVLNRFYLEFLFFRSRTNHLLWNDGGRSL